MHIIGMYIREGISEQYTHLFASRFVDLAQALRDLPLALGHPPLRLFLPLLYHGYTKVKLSHPCLIHADSTPTFTVSLPRENVSKLPPVHQNSGLRLSERLPVVTVVYDRLTPCTDLEPKLVCSGVRICCGFCGWTSGPIRIIV